MVGSGLSAGASRVVLDPRKAIVYFLYPDGSSGFWGAYQGEDGREVALDVARVFVGRGIPLGLADTTLETLSDPVCPCGRGPVIIEDGEPLLWCEQCEEENRRASFLAENRLPALAMVEVSP